MQFSGSRTRAGWNGKELFDVFFAISARASRQFTRHLRVPCYFTTPRCTVSRVLSQFPCRFPFFFFRVPPFTIFSLTGPARVSPLFLVTTTRDGLRKYSVSVPLASISIRLFHVSFSLLKQRALVRSWNSLYANELAIFCS